MITMKTKRVFILPSLLVLLIVLPVVQATWIITSPVYHINVSDYVSSTFSIMWITDTQHSSSAPAVYTGMYNWIVSNYNAYNTQMVIHTGDLTNIWKSDMVTSEWISANTTLGVLLNHNIPYVWCAGNHDQLPAENGMPSNPWAGIGYKVVSTTLMRTKPYWESDIFQGKNTAVKISYEGYNFLIIDMEFNANSSVLAWMENLVVTHPTYNVIVGTHYYFSYGGAYGSWSLGLKTILDRHPNVFLTLNGHADEPTHTADRYLAGTRNELFFNMQENNGGLGAATVRIMTFDLTTRSMSTKTYCVFNSTWLRDSQNQFTLNNLPLIHG
jgi:hypothetical protein